MKIQYNLLISLVDLKVNTSVKLIIVTVVNDSNNIEVISFHNWSLKYFHYDYDFFH